MGWAFFPAPDTGTFPVRSANLSAFLEDLLHEIISGESAARPPPILDASRPRAIGQQGSDLFFECGHALFKRRSGHDWTPASK
jgi:hypothetical protein